MDTAHGPMLPMSDVDYVKPMLLPHGGWPMAAGPVSRLGSFEPGDKTGLRLSLAQSMHESMLTYNERSERRTATMHAKGYIQLPASGLQLLNRRGPSRVQRDRNLPKHVWNPFNSRCSDERVCENVTKGALGG